MAEKPTYEELEKRIQELEQAETERTQAAESLRFEHNRLMGILTTIPYGVYIVSQQYDIEYINPVLEQEFGPVDGRKCYQYFHNLTEICTWCKNAEVFAGKSVQWEWYSTKNDRYYDLFDTPFLNTDGSISKFEIFHDITERKWAEEALQEGEEKYRLLAESMNDVIIQLSPTGKVLYVSPNVIKFGGYDPKSEIGNDMSRYFANDTDIIRAVELLEKVLETHQSGSFEFLFKPKNKKPFPVEHTYLPILKNNKVTAIQLVLRDITERKQAEEELKWELTVTKVMSELSSKLISPVMEIADIMRLTQGYAQMLTDSKHGYSGVIEEETKDLICQNLTEMMGKDCSVGGKGQPIRFLIGSDGLYPKLWGHALNSLEPFFTNDPSNHSMSKSVPKGHVILKNFLTAPAVHSGKLVGQIAVANSTRNYTSRDLEVVARLTDLFAIALGRKLSEKTLRESEQQLKYVLQNSINTIYSFNLSTGTYDYMSPSAEKMYGYTPEEMISGGLKASIENFHPDDTAKIDHHLKQLLSKKLEDFSPTVTYRFKHPKLGYRWMLDTRSVVYDANDNPISLIGNSVDITERKRTQDALRESEEKYRSMMEAMKDAAYICSSEFRIEYMNSRMTRRIGRDAVGELCHKAIYNSDEKCSWCVFDKIQQGQHYEYELANPKNNRHYSITNSPIFHSNGLISKLTIFRDITKNKAIESQLRQARKMETIGTLAGGIAHDLNNILFPIVGNTEMLLEDIPEDSPLHRNLVEVFTAAMRAKELVKQILAFSRQDSHEIKLMKMQPVIKDALKLIRSTIPTSIEIKQTVSNGCGAIKADPTQIHQVVMNLATNAYHAMEDTGGELKVNLKEVELGEQDLPSPDMEPGPYACLTVADTGTGISDNVKDRIFDPYFTTKEQGKGTGMGLATIHGIVLNAGGNIIVNSELGKGTEFQVYLPIVQPSFEQQATQAIKPIQRGTEQILLVDDEEAIVFMEKQMLERLGYSVVSRTSSVEALEAFRADPDKFDLVITDMAMPNMSGDKLASELIKISPDIPILLCTGFCEKIPEEKAKSMGIEGFLMKPIVRADLSKKIREVLENKEGSGEG